MSRTYDFLYDFSQVKQTVPHTLWAGLLTSPLAQSAIVDWNGRETVPERYSTSVG